jgi:UDP-hydrolysing UDP-N-acetyl-D-glucosamine 2-epimerase
MLSNHRNGDRIDQEEFFQRFKGVGGRFDLEENKFLLVSQHPVTTEYGLNRKHIEETLEALTVLKMPTIMIWPNADAGSDEVSKGIRTFREKYKPDWLHLFINLPIEVYTKLMDLCACMIGNSSSAIREGAFIGVPAVNVGSRQNGREKGKNVINVEPSGENIRDAILAQIDHGKYEREEIYGDGHAGEAIAMILSSLEHVRPQKQISY